MKKFQNMFDLKFSMNKKSWYPDIPLQKIPKESRALGKAEKISWKIFDLKFGVTKKC